MSTQPQNPSLLDVAGDIRAPQFAFTPAATWDEIMRDLGLMPPPASSAANVDLQTRAVTMPGAANGSSWLEWVRANQTWIIAGSAALILFSLMKK